MNIAKCSCLQWLGICTSKLQLTQPLPTKTKGHAPVQANVPLAWFVPTGKEFPAQWPRVFSLLWSAASAHRRGGAVAQAQGQGVHLCSPFWLRPLRAEQQEVTTAWGRKVLAPGVLWGGCCAAAFAISVHLALLFCHFASAGRERRQNCTDFLVRALC